MPSSGRNMHYSHGIERTRNRNCNGPQPFQRHEQRETVTLTETVTVFSPIKQGDKRRNRRTVTETVTAPSPIVTETVTVHSPVEHTKETVTVGL